MSKQILYKEIPAPDDPIYAELWPEIVGTNCWILISHNPESKIYRKIMNCPDNMVVMHKCDNGKHSKQGCCINPLHMKIGTIKENTQDCSKKKRIKNGFNSFKSPRKGKKLSEKHRQHLSKPVVKIDFHTNEIIERFYSIKEASEKTGINYLNISSCCNGKRKHVGGFIWKFC